MIKNSFSAQKDTSVLGKFVILSFKSLTITAARLYVWNIMCVLKLSPLSSTAITVMIQYCEASFVLLMGWTNCFQSTKPFLFPNLHYTLLTHFFKSKKKGFCVIYFFLRTRLFLVVWFYSANSVHLNLRENIKDGKPSSLLQLFLQLLSFCKRLQAVSHPCLDHDRHSRSAHRDDRSRESAVIMSRLCFSVALW